MGDHANASKGEKDGERELAKQLSTYADGFTAFSFVQGAAFCFLVGQNATVACVLQAQWWIAEICLAIAGAGYFFLLYLCHGREDFLVPLPGRGGKVARVVQTVRRARFCIVGVATLGEMLMVLATRAIPVFKCSKILG